MKVLLAHNNFAINGGAEVFYHEVGRVLEEKGHDVAYFSVFDKEIDSNWSKYFPKAADYQNSSMINKISSFPSMVYSNEAKKKMALLIADFKPDIIHTFSIYVKLTPSILDAARKAGVPVVMSCNDYKHICPNYKLYCNGHVCEDCAGGRFLKAAVNRCCHDSLIFSVASSIEAFTHDALDIYRKNVHTFLFASDFMAHKTEEFWGKDSFRWRKLRNPFDSTKYEANFSPNGAILFFGRLIEEKGVDVLIHAASKVPEAEFRIIGDGPDMNMLQRLAETLKTKNVSFLGPKWGEAMNDELKKCRFVVVPSTWHENFPYVINQSFAFGKPVVGSRRGGITELVSDGERGRVYEAENYNELSLVIKELWHNPDLVEVMGRNAKKFSDRVFNDNNFYNSLESIYREVLS